ncbi:S8 family serine peptidase [Mucilaginibacter sp. PPCGB 2223]|uniref:S8 family serine peptidase n=1 Tax=Mucilaginibacter sp. PPCGB 2223 TaxID=1886027 RepID=UPI000AC4F119|nr:S8 family serine peptidase [Mucilaginibacter sp. PPCGB 2223]
MFVFGAGNAFSQDLVTDAIKKEHLTDLSKTLNTTYQEKHKRALELAKQKGWPVFKTAPQGVVLVLDGVNELGFPVYLKTNDNVIAAATTRTNTVQPGGALNLNLDGSTAGLVNKLAIWDGSTVYAAHQEFAGKNIVNKDNSTAAVIDHSTHVAGTMIAKGVYAPAKGMSFGATSLLSYDFNNELSEIAAAASGLLISNHSYGYTFGWNYTGTRWEWYGLPGDSEDYNFGQYNSTSIALDQTAVAAPLYLMVFAAGNARGYNGPAVGSTYYGYTSRTDQTIVNKGPRPANLSSQLTYDNLDSHAVAKNVLTVGAVNQLPNGPSGSSSVQMSSFSSWGPTDDGRVKPDICGMGVNVLSSITTATNAYGVLSGTSMATPNVSGSLYLLQEYYTKKYASFMNASTLKGLVCHTALDAGNPGPDYVYGWGLLDMGAAAQAITDNGTKSMIAEKTLTQGQTQTYNVVASGNGALMATICWTDPAGTANAVGVINDRTPKLVNDLDIRITDGTTTFKPWVLDPNSPSTNATTGDNTRDNVEQVYVQGTIPGKAYTITVTHKGTLTFTSQPYSLIVTGIGGSVYCASAPASNADSKITNVTLADLNYTSPTGCTTYTNNTSMVASLEQGKTYALSISLGTCGSNFNKIVKAYIDWNGNGTFDSNELVATSGVYAANGVFTTNITVPTTVTPGNLSAMRLVLSETTDPATISACGSYAKGETQDYTVKFLQASIDAGVIAVNSPAVSGTCASATSPVSVKIKNFGTTTLSNIPVTVTITPTAGGAVTTLNEVYAGPLTAGSQADFQLSGTFNAVAGASYSVTAASNLSTDLNSTNNQVTANEVINTVPVISSALASYCTDLKLYNLSGTANGTIFWYKNIGDALPFTAGASVNTTVAPVNNVYYAGVNDFSGTIGPPTKNTFTAGGYNQYTPAVYISTKVPILIQSAKLYIGNPGTIVFSVTNSSGITVSTTTLNVTATRTVAAAGDQPDDPNDQGKVYQLNLALPTAGTYSINVSYPDAATIYRNNGGVTGYPFTLNGIFSITGNSATSATNPSDTTYYRNFYYFFYNMQVKSLDCVGGPRIAVNFAKPAITLNGTKLTSNFTSNNQWYLNGILIPGATSQTYTPLVSGIYRVDVTTVSGCVSKSDDFSFVLPATSTGDGSDISLAVFPVPASTQLHIAFVATKSEPLTLMIKNAIGQSVFSSTQQLPQGPFNTIVNVANLPDGVYFLQLKIDDKTYVRRITVLK